MKKSVRIVLIVVFSALLLFSSWQLLEKMLQYKQGQNSYAELEQFVSMPDLAPEKAPEKEDAPAPTVPDTELPEVPNDEPADRTAWPVVDFAELEKINPDVVGWIYIPRTGINYPVVQGADNDYYLHRLFDGTYHNTGCIFMDADNAADLTDPHTIIYGHNMKDHTMFAELISYEEQEFYDEHPEALLITPTCRYKIRLFSGYVSDTWSDAWKKDFGDQDLSSWLLDITSHSCFSSEVLPTAEDRIVTLSTCSYAYESARFVVHGYIEDSYAIEAHIPIQ